jgi:hypothetical protein
MGTDLLRTDQTTNKHEYDLVETILTVGKRECPFTESITRSTPRAKTNAAFGHTWNYDEILEGELENAHLEGSKSPELSKSDTIQKLNHYQIIKDGFGVTGSEEASLGIDGVKEKARQGKHVGIKHNKTIEKILLSDQAPVKRNATTAGRMGGIKHFLSVNNDFDCSGLALDWKLLREVLKNGFLRGVPYSYIILPDTQKDAIDDILFSKTNNLNMSTTKIDNNVTIIGQTAYGNNIKLILCPTLDDSEIIAYQPKQIHTVFYRPTVLKSVNLDEDGSREQFITEMTLRVDTPFAMTRLKNLKV